MFDAYIYKGKDIPKKSGYSTAILVHKEGIMTNEEIYKYADKKLQKRENKYFLKYSSIAFFGGVGLILMCQPLEYSCPLRYSVFVALGICVLLPILFASFVFSLQGWFKIRRNYIYNLVRADERNRLQVSKR